MTTPSPSIPPPEPPQSSQAPDGRARMLAALRWQASRGQAVAGVLLALLGFAAVTQVQSNDRDDAYVGARQGDLIQYINTLSLASERAESEITRLEETRDALGNDTDAARTALALARQQATSLGILAGTLPAQGPGVRITVRDTSGAVGTNQLIDALQELRDAGAEVIELNDEVRVVAQTSLEDTGQGVVADGVRLRAPYVIDAIGDPQTLDSALDFTGGFVAGVEEVGGAVTVTRGDAVEVTSVREAATPRYAEPEGTR